MCKRLLMCGVPNSECVRFVASHMHSMYHVVQSSSHLFARLPPLPPLRTPRDHLHLLHYPRRAPIPSVYGRPAQRFVCGRDFREGCGAATAGRARACGQALGAVRGRADVDEDATAEEGVHHAREATRSFVNTGFWEEGKGVRAYELRRSRYSRWPGREFSLGRAQRGKEMLTGARRRRSTFVSEQPEATLSGCREYEPGKGGGGSTHT